MNRYLSSSKHLFPKILLSSQIRLYRRNATKIENYYEIGIIKQEFNHFKESLIINSTRKLYQNLPKHS